MTTAQTLLEIATLAAGAIGRDLAPPSKSITKTAAKKTTATVKAVAKKAAPNPKPILARFAMYDAVNVTGIPVNATHVAGYVNGRYANLTAMRARFPKATILTIAVTAEADADCLDVETGDATPGQAPTWVRRQLARGVKRPMIYANRSTMPAVWAELKAAGFKRNQVRLWVADWTGQPHIPAGYDACQWISTNSYDESLCTPRFLT